MWAPDCPMSPFLVFTEDSEGRVDKISIAGEKWVILDADDVVSAVSSLILLFPPPPPSFTVDPSVKSLVEAHQSRF
jgi:hypothetical protein